MARIAAPALTKSRRFVRMVRVPPSDTNPPGFCYCFINTNNGGTMLKNFSRRDFLKSSAAVAAPMIVPASVFGAQAPSERLGIGHIGVGTMGYNHVKGLIGEKAVQILAVCD